MLIGNFDNAVMTLLSIENEELKTLAKIRVVGIELKRNKLQQAQHHFEYVLPRIDKLRE